MTKTGITAIAAGLIVGTASANAAMISFSDTFTSQPVPGMTTLNLPKFDPALGTLLKVTIELDATANGGSISFDNESTATPGANVTLTIGATLEAIAPNGATLIAIPTTMASSMVGPDSDGDPDFVGSDAFTLIGMPSSDSDMAMLNSGFAPYIAAFMGDTFEVMISSENFATWSVTNGFGPGQSSPGEAGGTFTVTYEYIPSPGTFALGALGLCAMLRRHRED